MAGFAWQQIGAEFHTATRYGEVVIAERQGQYRWRIEESALGIAIYSDALYPVEYRTFEHAEEFVLLTLAFLAEPPTVDPANPQSWLYDRQVGKAGLRATLATGERALPPDTDWTHHARLLLIRRVMFGEPPASPAGNIACTPPSEVAPPEWIQVGDAWQATTRFGRAVIIEHREEPSPWIIGRRSWYTTRIEHPNGAAFPCGLGREPRDFPNFEEAEAYIMRQLDRLAHPLAGDTDDRGRLLAEAEIYYPWLEFTLDVCAKALGPDADPIHIARFEHLKGELFLKLD